MANPNSSVADESRATVIAALIANLGIAATKFVAAALSGSAAMLAEAIHSTVDSLNELFLLYGMSRAEKPADAQHPLGYGMETFFWSFVVAVLIFALGSGLSIYEGINALLTGRALSGEHFPTAALVVLTIAFAFEGYSWNVARRNFFRVRDGKGLLRDFRALKDPSVFVVLLEDSAALFGISIAAGGLLLSFATGRHLWDASASIMIGVVLGLVAMLLAQEVRKLLIGESARPEIVAAVQAALDLEEVEGVNEIRSVHLGPKDVLVLASVDFRDDTRAARIERIVTQTHGAIAREFPDVKRLYVEVQSRAGHSATSQYGEKHLMA